MNKCEGCGARRDLKETVCPYCGTPYPIDEKQVEQTSKNTIANNTYDYTTIPEASEEQKAALKTLLPGIILFFVFPFVGFFVLLSSILKLSKGKKK